MRDFRKLKVWDKAHRLILQVYRITNSFPSDEQFGLTVQLRRAAASVPTNIAEGCYYRHPWHMLFLMLVILSVLSSVILNSSDNTTIII
jgi:hypothetical protein